MSLGQDYFPPQGTKWKWSSKALKHSPWHCNLSNQKYPKLFLWPLSVRLTVDYHGATGMFNWSVEIIDFVHQRTYMNGCSGNALKACRSAEVAGELEMNKHLPRWVMTALRNKWRPPYA